MKRLLLAIIGSGLGLILLVIILLHTGAGLKLGLAFMPGEVSVVSANGTLAGTVTLSGVEYEGDGLVLRLDRLELNLAPYRLLRGTVYIRSLLLDGVHVQTSATESAPTSTETTALNLPVGFRLDELRINGMQLQTEGEQAALNINSVTLSTYGEGQTVHIETLRVDAEQFDLTLNGSIMLGDVYAYELTAGLGYLLDEQHAIDTDLQVSGDTDETRLTGTIRTPSIISIDMQLTELLGTPGWEGSISTTQFNSADFTDQIAPHIFSANLQTRGTLASARIEGAVQSYSGAQPDTPDNAPALALEQLDLALAIDTTGLDTDVPAFNGRLNWTDVSITQLTEAPRRLDLETGVLELDYEDAGYSFNLNTGLVIDELISGNLSGRGHGTMTSVSLDDFTLGLEQGQFQGSAELEQQQNTYQGYAQANWQQFILPISPEQTVYLDNGSLRLEGGSDSYTLQSETSVALNSQPPLQLQLDGSGDLGRFDLTGLTLVSADGTGQVTVAGQLAWADTPSAELSISGTNINPGIYLPEWPGKLELEGRLSASGQAEDYEVNVPELSIRGQLGDHSLELVLASQLTPGDIEITRASLVAGANRFMLDGNWGERYSLQWSVQAPELNDLYAGINGSLEATGTLAGAADNPQLEMELHGERLDSPWGSLQFLDTTAAMDLADQGPLDIVLSASGLEYGDRQLDSVRLTAKGSLETHDYTLTVEGEPLTLAMEGRAGYGERNWAGETRRLEVTLLDQTWAIRSPFESSVGEEGVSISGLCLTLDITGLCIDGHYADIEHWQGEANLSGMPIEAVNPYLPAAITMTGKARLDIKGERDGAALPEVSGNLASDGASVEFQIDRNTTQELFIKAINGQFSLSGGRLESELVVLPDDEQQDQLQVRLDLGPLASLEPELDELEMTSELKWAVRDLSFISTVSNQLTDVSGELLVDLGFNGAVREPVLSGEISLRDGGMMFPEFGIELTELGVRGQPQPGNGFQLAGSAMSGTGALSFNADITPDEPENWLVASLTGTDIEAMNTPEIRARASTDLKVDIGSSTTRVQGDLDIHDAVIDLDEMRESVTLSDDVVMVDETPDGEDAARSVVDITIRLNENIRIRGQGISGQLSGQLDIDSTEKGDLLGNGEIRITDGKYKAYGQDLTIEEGRILYRNTPLDNPELRVRAIRRINDDISAGLIITGILSNPQVTLTSTPSMSDEDILAYIVFGRPLSSLNSGEGTNLIGAATSLGVKNSGVLTRSLSSTFGLDQLELTSDSSGENAALSVGKFITPRLYISYVVGLMESFSTARIRYNLTESWSLEAKSGASVGVDLLYTIEK